MTDATDATKVFEPLQADDPPAVAGYRLAARLGAGGMGRVYLSHTQGGRPVAIKVIRPELADDPAFRRGFRREIKAAQRVRGAYTAELIDADADGVPPWLATLYVPGPSLAEAVARRGPLPVPAVLWLMAGVAEALEAVHGAGIVHRDLKPSNVLLAADGPRVIDFGISLAADVTSYTATGATVGTPQFMAPEQASAGEVTTATDVFALGQTAAFAALGRPLYGEGSAVGVLYRIVHSEPDLSLLPAQLRPLMARCLAADPRERATPAEIVTWCRQRLGAETGAGEGTGPAVWREIAGPEVTVPPPVPHPTPVHTLPLHSHPQTPQPQPYAQRSPWAPPQTQPTWKDQGPARRRRTGLIAAAAATAGALLLAGVTWTALEVGNRLGDRDEGASSTSGSTAPGGPPATGRASGADDADAEGTAGAGGRTSKDPEPLTTASESPKMNAHPLQWLDAKTSLSFKKPIGRKDRKGDIRFYCKEISCGLESDTSLFVMVPGDPGATLDTCRLLLDGAEKDRTLYRELPLAGAAAGTEICVKHSSGDVALLVLQVKSTALPEAAFLTLDMTVWRGAV
ncbi:serine/threonine-protein kinase [Streptomyces sp. 8P21H-1]|uniref:serine/threonine-protein kinase n=1 Tax=Streptomyces sp. 8P21H-1 TaxID=2737048 RepID=UPI00156F0C0B|nr:serine/threonine-protein kinase [Streptomyces sp. 8P21H-1]NSL43420.1 serine/threonine protein kinase [Streptomyces sp. 8P21H-1]